MKRTPEKTVNPYTSVYLFNKENPKGKVFKLIGGKESDEYKKLLDDGWFDTPARLNLPKEDSLNVTSEQFERMRPEDHVSKVKGYGFIVLTPEQLQAEINKMVSTHIDIKHFTDEALIEEAERRGLKEGGEPVEDEEVDELAGIESINEEVEEDAPVDELTDEPNELDELLNQFNEDPESLTKPELVKLGNEMFTLGLRANMLEATLIEKINAALNDSE